MKNFITLILLSITTISFGQTVDYSIDAGTNYNFFTLTSLGSYDPEAVVLKEVKSSGKIGLYINNNFMLPVNKHLSFKTGFGISIINADYQLILEQSRNNSNVNILDSTWNVVIDTSSVIFPYVTQNLYTTENEYNFIMIKLPMQLQFNFFKQKLFFQGGISIAAIVQAKTSVGTSSGKFTYRVGSIFEKVFFNMNFGIEYKLYKNLYAGILYEYSLTNIFRNSNVSYNPPYQIQQYTYDTYKIHLNSFALNLSYKFK